MVDQVDSHIDIPISAAVRCRDGRCGKSKIVIVDPTTMRLTKIVVEYETIQYLVPRALVVTTAPDKVVIECTREELRDLEPFGVSFFINADLPDPGYPSGSYMIEPFVTEGESDSLLTTECTIPPGQLTFRRNNAVYTNEGRIGKVDEFVVDRQSGDITHIILREGHLWGKRDIAIEVGAIESTRDNRVTIALSKNDVAKLPKFPVERRWERNRTKER